MLLPVASTPRFGAASAVVSLHRHLTAHGQHTGGVALRLSNHHPRCEVGVRVLEVLPWFLKPYFHALTLTLEEGWDWRGRGRERELEQEQEQEQGGGQGRGRGPGVQQLRHLSFTPSESRGPPARLELELVLPPASHLTLWLPFERALMNIEEYPPDPNRGVDVGSAVASFTLGCACDEGGGGGAGRGGGQGVEEGEGGCGDGGERVGVDGNWGGEWRLGGVHAVNSFPHPTPHCTMSDNSSSSSSSSSSDSNAPVPLAWSALAHRRLVAGSRSSTSTSSRRNTCNHDPTSSSSSSTLLLYSEPLLVSLPTPDFSMPYNVITLSSTVIAFFLGSMLNMMLRRKRAPTTPSTTAAAFKGAKKET